jgi:hypothetical protein
MKSIIEFGICVSVCDIFSGNTWNHFVLAMIGTSQKQPDAVYVHVLNNHNNKFIQE